ncbi:hypothetical protein D3C87_2154680 [compost metagenome]
MEVAADLRCAALARLPVGGWPVLRCQRTENHPGRGIPGDRGSGAVCIDDHLEARQTVAG